MKDFVKADVKASRYRKGYKKIGYKELLKDNANISLEEYKDLICSFSRFCCEVVANTRDGIELPADLGVIRVNSYKEKRKVYDIPTSIKVGKLVTYKNHETDGYSAKIFYSNLDMQYKFVERELWRFVAVREFKNLVSKTFVKNWKMYYECVPLNKKATIESFKKHDIVKPKMEDIFNDYNEFDI